mmetsp:Transcript_8894/g.32073  ORF Transcript_8894/g.32073 Transcript_8894/m.32073 type:complete len:265 (-) Transcript_8894:34-828(-)
MLHIRSEGLLEHDLVLHASLVELRLQLLPVDPPVGSPQGPLALLAAVQEHGGLRPGLVQTVLQAQGLELVDPHAVVVRPKPGRVGVHDDDLSSPGGNPLCDRQPRGPCADHHEVVGRLRALRLRAPRPGRLHRRSRRGTGETESPRPARRRAPRATKPEPSGRPRRRPPAGLLLAEDPGSPRRGEPRRPQRHSYPHRHERTSQQGEPEVRRRSDLPLSLSLSLSLSPRFWCCASLPEDPVLHPPASQPLKLRLQIFRIGCTFRD